SNLGSNFPRGQFARFLDVILRGARVWMASCGALDRAEARQARKTRKLILLTGQCPLWVKSGHVHCTSPCPLYPRKRTLVLHKRMSALGQKRTHAAQQKDRYSITSSARPSRDNGISNPSSLAVFRLMTSSTFVACWTGKSAGFSPLSIRPTYIPTAR